jgi:quinol monooxygenase YgiN
MSVFSIWKSRFPRAHREEGREVTEAIWRDMRGFTGYLRHALLEDLDDPGHLIVVSEWASRADADRVLAEYAQHPNAQRANELVSMPRQRTVAQKISNGAEN